jgi:dsDNA-binding SOS-regulon protein
MANGSRQVREKWLDLIANMLSDGKERSEILQTVIKDYKASEGTIDKWIKQAKIIVSERRQQAEAIRIRETESVIKEAVKSGLKSNLEIEQRLLQIGWAQIDVEETTDNPDFGVTIFRRKPSPAEQRSALAEVLKMRGAYAPSKVAQTDTKGNDVQQIDYSKISQEAIKELLNAAT